MFTSAGNGSVDRTTSQSIACSRPSAVDTRATGRPSRSSRTTGEWSSTWLPAFRTSSAMLSYSRLMPFRGYMYFVK